jgi:hypothetical protein
VHPLDRSNATILLVLNKILTFDLFIECRMSRQPRNNVGNCKPWRNLVRGLRPSSVFRVIIFPFHVFIYKKYRTRSNLQTIRITLTLNAVEVLLLLPEEINGLLR